MTNWRGGVYDKYRELCLQAATQDQIFSGFKGNPLYKPILEHVSYHQGLQYLNRIKSSSSEVYTEENFNKFRQNDDVGSPDVFCDTEFGKISATTLRYINVLMDIHNIFGDISVCNLVEIGAGYGGQTKIINDMFSDVNFTVVDLLEPTKLQERYLSEFNISPEFISAQELYEKDGFLESDIVISNYAISEISLENQDVYINKILKYSKEGYMICNGGRGERNNRNHQQWEMSLKSIGKNVFTQNEEPSTGSSNKVFAWKK